MLLDLSWISWARRPGLEHGDTNHSVARRTEVLQAGGRTASELTQVDASGCESGDNGGKGNQTAPASGRLAAVPTESAIYRRGTVVAAVDAVNGLEIS